LNFFYWIGPGKNKIGIAIKFYKCYAIKRSPSNFLNKTQLKILKFFNWVGPNSMHLVLDRTRSGRNRGRNSGEKSQAFSPCVTPLPSTKILYASLYLFSSVNHTSRRFRFYFLWFLWIWTSNIDFQHGNLFSFLCTSMIMTSSIQYSQVAGGNSIVAPIQLFFSITSTELKRSKRHEKIASSESTVKPYLKWIPWAKP